MRIWETWVASKSASSVPFFPGSAFLENGVRGGGRSRGSVDGACWAGGQVDSMRVEHDRRSERCRETALASETVEARRTCVEVPGDGVVAVDVR